MGRKKKVVKKEQEQYIQESPIKEWLIGYVGNKKNPESKVVTTELIVEVMSEEFPEFVDYMAEQFFIKGYEQALDDDKNVKIMVNGTINPEQIFNAGYQKAISDYNVIGKLKKDGKTVEEIRTFVEETNSIWVQKIKDTFQEKQKEQDELLNQSLENTEKEKMVEVEIRTEPNEQEKKEMEEELQNGM